MMEKAQVNQMKSVKRDLLQLEDNAVQAEDYDHELWLCSRMNEEMRRDSDF